MFEALHSIRFRIILPLIVVTLLLTEAVALYNLRLAEAAEPEQAWCNAVLLADVLDAGIQTEANLAPDTLQAQIGSLTAANPDTQEFNVILLQGAGSTIVASNDPGNLEATLPEEHQALLDVLQRGQPIVLIEREIVEYTPPKPEGSRSLVLSLFAPIRLEGEAGGDLAAEGRDGPSTTNAPFALRGSRAGVYAVEAQQPHPKLVAGQDLRASDVQHARVTHPRQFDYCRRQALHPNGAAQHIGEEMHRLAGYQIFHRPGRLPPNVRTPASKDPSG